MRKTRLRSVAATLLTAVLFNSVPFLSVKAADSPSYTLSTSPVVVNETIKPGTTYTTELRVKSDSPTAQRLKVTFAKFTAQGENGDPAVAEREAEDSYFDWVSVSPSEFDAQPNEWKTVTLTFSPPASALGGYYLAVRFSRVGDADLKAKAGETAVRGTNAILTLFEVSSPGNKRAMEVTEFSVKPSVMEFLPAKFSIRAHNSGNVHVAAAGTIFINQGSKQIDSIPINKEGGNVLPSSNRIYESSWSNGFPFYKPRPDDAKKSDLQWSLADAQKLRFGQYTAKMVLVYRDEKGNDIPIESSISFWVVPWRIIAGLLLLIIFVPVGVYVTVRRALRIGRRPKSQA